MTAKKSNSEKTSLLVKLFSIEGAGTALVFIILILLFMFTAPRAFTGYRIYMSFMASVPPALIIALGLTLVASAGEMDLSFPATVAFGSYIFSMLFQQYEFTWIALFAAVMVGTLMGFINGWIITKLGIPSMIASLAMMFLWGGLVTIISNGISIAIPTIQATFFHTIMVGRIGGYFPAQMIWALAISAFIWLLLNRHPFGENILFIGDSEKVAKVVGIPVARERIKLFTLMGALSALAGVFLTVETNVYFSSQGQGYLLTVIAAVFIGGTSIFGGSGKVVGTVFAALIVAIIEAGLVASGIQGFWTRFFIGVVFILSVVMNNAIEDPDKVPLIKSIRLRMKR
ncbi:MAG: ABC transporter permease [Hyphomicrobiales bacterium]|nr:ABC transporter permease [Hyphomicrobiales bacterium]